VLGPASVPEVTEPAAAERETELAVLSAVAHGNGPNGLAVVQAALVALGRLDREHAAVYFQIIWNALREPMRRALEALVMERQIEDKATFPPFAQQLIDRGFREGELKGLRDALLRLSARAGITLTEDEHARIQACDDAATLERWVQNVLGAKTAADILS
jgi:urease accessory protein UreF